MPVKERLVSKYDNKTDCSIVPLHCFCVSHSAKQDIIIIMSIAIICLARVTLKKRLNMNFRAKKKEHTFTNIYFFTRHHNVQMYTTNVTRHTH